LLECEVDEERKDEITICRLRLVRDDAFISFKRHCPSVLLSPHSLPVVMLCKTSQPQFALHFVQAPHRVHAHFGCPPRSVAPPLRIQACLNARWTKNEKTKLRFADCA